MNKLYLVISYLLVLSACDNAEPQKNNQTKKQELAVETSSKSDLPLEQIKLPDGFEVSIYSDLVPGARSMAIGEDGTLYVGTRQKSLYALPNADNDQKADKVITLADNLNSPNGVAIKNGSLYVAEISRVSRYDNIGNNLSKPPKPVVVNDKFPKVEWHGWKYIAFGPDDKLYVPVGAPCNVCERDENKYANIMRMNVDGSNLETFAKGIRNTVGFAWHPVTKELWFTDNGRDMLGDDSPWDELNHAPKAGMHFGFPYCHQGDVPDPKYKKGCAGYTAPIKNLGPHVAALGMKFYTGSQFPAKYKNAIFIAEHGSWNRSSKIGYRVMVAMLEGNKVVSYEPFAEGWLQQGNEWGRPVDVLVMKDGSLLVSDDKAGVIYRISYTGN